jgi:hypothetical protein
VSDYKATPEQWVNLERRQLGGNDLVCAALELRARVEALEANRLEKPDSSDPAGSLVERVVAVIADLDGPKELWRDDARAAIREVAAWLDENTGGDAAWLPIENSQPCSSGAMRAARRPKPPSLKEQALALLNHDPANQPFLSDKGIDIIRRALEQLPE